MRDNPPPSPAPPATLDSMPSSVPDCFAVPHPCLLSSMNLGELLGLARRLVAGIQAHGRAYPSAALNAAARVRSALFPHSLQDPYGEPDVWAAQAAQAMRELAEVRGPLWRLERQRRAYRAPVLVQPDGGAPNAA